MEHDQAIIDFFFEIGQLKRYPRSGWQLLGIKQPESIADHTCRSVFIAYVLAKMEGANPERAALIAAFHELPETRTQDTTKVAQKYNLGKKEQELAVMKDQLAGLPEDIRNDFLNLLTDFEKDTDKEQIVARDADYLECLIQAREYLDQGYKGAQNWIDNCHMCFKTESAKKLGKQIEKSDPAKWHRENKHIKR